MLFVGLAKFQVPPTKAVVEENLKMVDEDTKKGITFKGIYWTLGKYDAVAIYEAPNEKEAMKMAIRRAKNLDLQTLVAIPIEEAKTLVG